MYWKEIRSEAWIRTKTTMLSRERRVLSILVPICAAILAVILMALLHLPISLSIGVTVVSAIGGFLIAVFYIWLSEILAIPPARDAARLTAINDKTAQIDELHSIMKGPDAPLPPIGVQADHIMRLLRQARMRGHQTLWLSEMLALGKEAFTEFLPLSGQIDYPAALRALSEGDTKRVQILETKQCSYVDFYQKRFDEDIQFRIGAV
jgi:hypothetical protein